MISFSSNEYSIDAFTQRLEDTYKYILYIEEVTDKMSKPHAECRNVKTHYKKD